jgi:hypothetical protein
MSNTLANIFRACINRGHGCMELSAPRRRVATSLQHLQVGAISPNIPHPLCLIITFCVSNSCLDQVKPHTSHQFIFLYSYSTNSSQASLTIFFAFALGYLLTVKIRQPSHEFTFGVGMSFIPYPLVLTPVV